MENNDLGKKIKEVANLTAKNVREKTKDVLDDTLERGEKVKNQIACKASDAVDLAQDAGKAAIEALRNTKNEFDMKYFGPVNKDIFLSKDFNPPKIIRVIEKNNHRDKETCADAVGFVKKIAHSEVLELVHAGYPENEKYTFLPTFTESIYYINPYASGEYIALDDYFDFAKKARVSELENVANKLGAKYVKISMKEEKKSFVAVNGKAGKKAKAKNKLVANNNCGIDGSVKDLKEISVESEVTFFGHNNPEKPDLVYFKNDKDIESLINWRMNSNNVPMSKTYNLKYSRTHDINMKAAAEIDSVIEKLSLKATASVQSEIENEKRMYLEYQIKF